MIEEIDGLLNEHALWVDSFGKHGKQLHVENIKICDVDLSGKNLSSSIFNNVEFQNVNFSNSDMFDVHFTRCKVINSSFFCTESKKSNWNGTHILNSDLRGFSGFRTTFHSGAFTGCAFVSSDLTKAGMFDVTFENAIFCDTIFFNTFFDRSTFKNVTFCKIRNFETIHLERIRVIDQAISKELGKKDAIDWISRKMLGEFGDSIEWR